MTTIPLTEALSVVDRCTVLSGLRRSLLLLHYNYLRQPARSSTRAYWLGEIRTAYNLYRRFDFGETKSFDRYAELVRFVTSDSV